MLALVLAGSGAFAASDTPGPAQTPAPPTQVVIPGSGETEQDRQEKASAAGDVASIEKEVKMVADAALLGRLQRVATRLIPVCGRPTMTYTIKVINSGSLNAFSLPGGYIYVTKGLMEAVESDDELAAVLGHEIGHIALRHGPKQEAAAKRMEPAVVGAILVAVLTGRAEAGLVVQQIEEGRLNHYGRDMELEADQAGVETLRRAQYNPVAMLTVLEGLARMERASPISPEELGSGQTHPLAEERAAKVAQRLKGLNVDVVAGRREVTNVMRVLASPVTVQGKTEAEVTIGSPQTFAVFRPAPRDGQEALARAQAIAQRLNDAMLSGIRAFDVALKMDGTQAEILARGEPVLTVYPEDAAVQGATVEEVAEKAHTAILQAFQQENRLLHGI